MSPNEYREPIEKGAFEFAQLDKNIHDLKFETKPIGYFKDAWIRFRKNKSSVVAAIIIIVIVLFGLLAPLFSNHAVYESDITYKKKTARSFLLSKIGLGTAITHKTVNQNEFNYIYGIGVAATFNKETDKNSSFEIAAANKYNPVKGYSTTVDSGKTYYNVDVEVYYQEGFQFKQITQKEYDAIIAWEKESGLTIIYPVLDVPLSENDANMWYTEVKNGVYVDNYKRDKNGDILYETPIASSEKDAPKQYRVRILYYNYYIYQNGNEPQYILGTDTQGYDIMVRLAYGIRLSLLLSVFVSIINFIIGAIYGAVEGYYGGWIDLIMERISDILNEVPFLVVATLFQLHLVRTGKVSAFTALLFAFVLTGWLGTAYRVRTQFYRFKGQEYVLAARTLGAGDARIMFKHIFPNAIGTIITSSVLVIPGVIFSESFLSYLGIVNLQGKNTTSLGAMLANGQGSLMNFPHIIFWPSLVISLLMISFNLFGNGLRDAFNPSLRGTEE